MTISNNIQTRYQTHITRILATPSVAQDIRTLITKFDIRFRLNLNQDIKIEKKYFISSNFSKHERAIYRLLLQNSSSWFCYEILYLICQKYEDLGNNVFLVKELKKNECEFIDKFRVNFIKDNDMVTNIKTKIEQFYDSITNIINKQGLHKNKITFLDKLIGVLINLKQQNIINHATTYNFSVDDFCCELGEIKRILCFNYKKKEREKIKFKMIKLDFRNIFGLCYLLRNHYVHNGLSVEIMRNSNLYVEFLRAFNYCFIEILIYFSNKVFYKIN